MNRDELLERVGGDEVLLQELVMLFLEDSPVLMDEIKKAVLDGNALAIRQSAHRLKGAAANFSATGAVEAALRLETMGRTGDLSGVREGLQVLEREMASLEPALRDLAAGG